MQTERFVSSRNNSKSNSDVVIEVVCNATPDTMFSYQQLAEALNEGSNHKFDRKMVQQVVNLANHRLLKEHKRCLRVVRGVGYRLVPATEHMDVAHHRTRKASKQAKWAWNTMVNVRLDEMTSQQRDTHVAQTILIGTLNQRTEDLVREQRAHAKAIASLYTRVEAVEEKVNGGK